LVSITNYKTDALKRIALYTYIPRIFSYFMGLVIIIIIFNNNESDYQDGPWIMPILFAICLGWPHLAFWGANKSTKPHKVIISSLMFDAFFTGLWIPLISFELIPSSAFLMVLMMNNISAGGFKLFLMGLFTTLAGTLISMITINSSIRLESNIAVLLACLPIIMIYPMLLVSTNYKLTRILLLQREKLVHLNHNDSLTGLFSRSYWEQRLLEEFNRCKRSNENACVMMVDIDHFKMINDTYGHLVGDQVLNQFGTLLKQLRVSDIAGRYGGEEFAVILPNSSLEESLQVSERLRKEIEKFQFDHIDTCTVSIGIALLDKNFEDAYQWLNAADKALYQSKKEGRNRVTAWHNSEIKDHLISELMPLA
jgi:diguanylate cyclase